MKKLVKQILSDVDGQGSSKRLAAFIVLLLIGAIAIGVTFFHANFNNSVWTDLNIAFGLSLGAITSEKFTNRKTPTGDA